MATINEAKENITGQATGNGLGRFADCSNLNSVVHDGIHKDSNTVLRQDLKWKQIRVKLLKK